MLVDRRDLKKYLSIAGIVVGVCLIVKNLSLFGELADIALSAMYPLFLGCAIAYVFNIFLSFCEKYYFPKQNNRFVTATRRPVCLILALGITITLITLILKIVIPELSTAFKIISAEIPEAVIALKDFAIERLHDYPEVQEKIYNLEFDWESISTELFDFVKTGATDLLSYVTTMVGAVFSSVVEIIVAIIFALYILLRKDRLRDDIKRTKNVYLKENINKKLTRIYHITNKTFKNFFVGQFVEAIILGVLCMIGMTILGIPYAAMTGAVIGVTALVPFVGAYVGAAIGAFVICTVDPMKALIFLIFLVILQQFEGNVIYPKVVGTSIGLPGIWVLAAVTIGGGLFGIPGMLIGVPTFATVYKIYHENLREREASKGIESPPPEEELIKAKQQQNSCRRYKLVEKSMEELKNRLNKIKNNKK